jgi:protein-S-isoprenylcysteine O-methyltransferase Ste14
MNHLSSPGLGIYVAHVAYFGAFVVARLIARASPREQQEVATGTERVAKKDTAPYSKVLVAFHMVGFVILYFGIGDAVFGRAPLALFESQMLAGSIVIGCGAVLCCWALLYFRSWRFRAQLNVGHELATGGPFRFLRHPIYMGLNLLGLGTALWIPTLTVWVGFIFMVVGSDLRARSEEALLHRGFGERYTTYCSRTRRFVPLLY